MREFKKLHIWHIGMELVREVYGFAKQLPREETYGLRSQMTRAAVSIPSNIAEGCGRESNLETARYIEIAIASSFELETQLIVCEEIGYLKKEETKHLQDRIQDFQKAASIYRRRLLE
ncbi:MAG: four helix bundle protein [Bacteroidota bacterium]